MHGRFSRISRFDLETFLLNVSIYFPFSALSLQEKCHVHRCLYIRACINIIYKTNFFTLSFYSQKVSFSLLVNLIEIIASSQTNDDRIGTFKSKRIPGKDATERSPRNPNASVIARKCDIPYARSRASLHARYLRSVCVAVPCVGRVVVARGQQGDTVYAATWSLYVMGTCGAREHARVFPPPCAKSARFHVRSNLRFTQEKRHRRNGDSSAKTHPAS